jgi:arylsulfatase A-like enzyme
MPSSASPPPAEGRRKNVVVFNTDQQRADSLGCMGNAAARTPNIDGIAARGVLYRNHYAANCVCMPSRASFITGRHVPAHGVRDNGVWLPAEELTMPEVFRRAGYRTASFGKLHFQTFLPWTAEEAPPPKPGVPAALSSMECIARYASGELSEWRGPYYGFEHVQITTTHGEGVGGHYGVWRRRHFPELATGPENARGGNVWEHFACWNSNIPLEAYHSTWVADRSCEWLERHEAGEPFYLNVSFPDPHHPFTPPAPHHSIFDGAELPAPHAVEGENQAKPLPWRRAMGHPGDVPGAGAQVLPAEVAADVLSHAYGMVALIDDCVGRVVAKLDAIGLLGETILVFTSDHGDFLGDHHLLYKGHMPCRSLLRVPLVIADPDAPAGEVDAVCSNVDVMPTLLSACGLPTPPQVQGAVLPRPGEPPRREHAFAAGTGRSSNECLYYALYKQDWRISVFPNLRDGELYDLRADPHEHRNLYHDPASRPRRDELMEELIFAAGQAQPQTLPFVVKW